MALGTYSQLATAVTSWMSDRTDISAQFDDFLLLAESDINRFLRVREMETTSSLTPDSDGKATIPDGYLEYRAVIWTGTPRRELKLIDPMQAEALYGYRESDTPRNFTIIGSTIQVLPVSTTAISLVHYTEVPALTSSATTNWLLTKCPNIYLFGVCRYAHAWLREPEDEAVLNGRFMDEVMKLNADDKGQRYARSAARGQGQRP